MPEQILETHIGSAYARQVAQTVVAQYQSIRDAERDVENAQIEALHARYEWGRALVNGVKQLGEGTPASDLIAEVAKQVDKSDSYLWHHKSFAEAVASEYPGHEPPVGGYVAECHDLDRPLTWRAAIQWMSTSTEEEASEDETDVQRQKEKVERLREKLDGAVSDLEKKASSREAESVATVAKQELEDTEARLERLPDSTSGRREDERYLKYVREQACIGCGVMEGTCDPHHLDRGGTGTKGSDRLTVPLCRGCHDQLHSIPEEEFWGALNPWKEAAYLQDQYIEALTKTE